MKNIGFFFKSLYEFVISNIEKDEFAQICYKYNSGLKCVYKQISIETIYQNDF